MVEVEILLSKATALKIGQLKYHLREDETADQVISEIIDPYLSSKLDLLVAKRMPREVLMEALGMNQPINSMPARTRDIVQPAFDEDIADLGDVDPEQIEASEPAPVKGGLTDAVLKADMEIEDPNHEAKSEALAVDLSSPDDFAAAIGMLDPRVQRRKKRFTAGKGKVTPMTSAVVEETF